MSAGLQVLDRAFKILSLFTLEHQEWTTTELARECGVPVPTTHRILASLLSNGFVARDTDTKRFRLGMAAMDLGGRARASAGIRALALPILRRLSQETGETALLTTLNDARDRSRCLERVESPQPLRLSVEPGRQLPLHAGSSQKILLAYMSDDEIDRILSQPLERLWKGTITNPGELRNELTSIREKQSAKSLEETNTGAWGLAVPIFDGSGAIAAGIGLAGPTARLSKGTLATHLRKLEQAALDIHHLMGSPGVSKRQGVTGEAGAMKRPAPVNAAGKR